MDFIVREYKPEDLEGVLDLVREMEAELAEKFTDVKIVSGVEDYRDRYLKTETKYKTFVGLVEGRVVGYLFGYPSLGAPEVDQVYDILPTKPGWAPHEFYLQMTFVSKRYRGQGISRRLHEEAVEYARRQGFKEVYACIAKWNESEIRVIRSLKFDLKDLGTRYRLTLKF